MSISSWRRTSCCRGWRVGPATPHRLRWPDPPGKLLAFAYGFEPLEIGGYEHLRRVAQRAADQEAVALVGRILPQERVAAQRFAANWDRAAEAALAALGHA